MNCFLFSGRCSLHATRWLSTLRTDSLSGNAVGLGLDERTRPRFLMAAILYVKDENMSSLDSKDSSSKSSSERDGEINCCG